MSETSRLQRARSDACPGALQVHAAADGGLARVRVPGGELTVSQLHVLTGAAAELGHPEIELTSRANLQVRGLEPGSERGLADRLAPAGLLPSATHERVRNIMASPYAGCDTRGLVTGVQSLVRELDTALCGMPELAELPGRFLFTVDDGRGDVAALDPDVGLLPVGEESMALLLAGRDHGLRVPRREAVRVAVRCARIFLSVAAAEESPVWRMAELAGGGTAVAAAVRAAPDTHGMVADVTPQPRPVPVTTAQAQVGEVGRRRGGVAVAVGAPLGRLSPAQLDSIIRAAGAGSGAVRLTPWRTVVLPDLAEGEVRQWLSELRAHGLVVEPSSAWSGVTACTGRPGCAKALADVREDANRVLPVAEHVGDDVLPVHWAGCERRCGRPRGRVVEVLATDNGYEVGTDSGDPEGVHRTWASNAGLAETAAAIDVARRGRSTDERSREDRDAVNEDSR